MEILIIQVLNSIFQAASLFLIAAGLCLIYGVMRIVNLAHGNFYAFGAYASAWAVGAAVVPRAPSGVTPRGGAALAVLAVASPAAQAPPDAPQEKPAATPSQPEDKPAPDDRAVNPSQPDFTIIGLPTTLKIPRFASAFRVTHRFTRSLGSGDFADLVREGFGFDGGAQIGLEYRFGIFKNAQIV